ncbi:TOMM precursor leader peptide-binding protein [Halobacillus salinarum]|uniref:TOMM leader peptide-binding protein n=1 Tax=Halobacillus salinarum TaxID=2932257 RepID=A0ABY4EM40_9BACI|nr:TOMM precursor leader peptide-binding protein [Halobacillus salinarum]UOQ45517.1 TOMM precursor leader peptide-binding protein [Halobacillus salinarum]
MTSISVAGKGQLAEHVIQQLSPNYQLRRLGPFDQPLEKDTLLLVLEDHWNPAAHLKAEEAARAYGVPWLRGFVSFGEGVIGPWVDPNTPGCSQCADARKLTAAKDRNDLWHIYHELQHSGQMVHDEWISEAGLTHMAQLITAEVERILSENADETMTLINVKTLETTRHVILPYPECPVCCTVPDDAPEKIELQPSMKISPNSYRSKSLRELSKNLEHDYLDSRTGLMNSKLIDFETPFADVIVNLPLMNGDEGTAGRTTTYAVSEMTAILEGLERSCGIAPKGKATVVYDCYNNLKSALHPLKVGVHSENQYAKEDFPFTPFSPDQKMHWVWGYSLIAKKTILVPERLAYYSMGCGDGFVFETSNGCALGGSLEEAIFHGIMEVLERDSFLMTWYAKLALPRIDPYSSEDKELTLMLDRMKEEGYELYLYNASMDHSVPCLFTIVKKTDPNAEGMNLMCAAGASFDPVSAVKSAIFESIGMIKPLNKQFEKNKAEYASMLQNDWLVEKMEDHGMLYALPEAEERLDFLLDQPIQQSFAEAFEKKQSHADLTEDLKNLLQEFDQLNLDVIVVDQTSSEISRNGLHCVKVLIPGMLPMTFGHHLRRFTGLSRVLTVPKTLGYFEKDLTPEELNPYPHPFP